MSIEYTKAYLSGNFLEIYEYEKAPQVRQYQVRKKRKDKSFVGDSIAFGRRIDNLRNTRRAFVRLVRSNLVGVDSPALLTLTMYEVVGIGQACDVFTRFVKMLRRNEGLCFRYIAVPEFQRRGAVHFHVLIWGIKNAIIEQERVCRYLQNIWQYGYVDCFATDGSGKLAGYLAKYMSKTVQDVRLCRKKAFMCSRNIMRPVSVSSAFSLGCLAEEQGFELSTAPVLHKSVSMTKWLGRSSYRLLNIAKEKTNEIDFDDK
jgi:hypothetical protein